MYVQQFDERNEYLSLIHISKDILTQFLIEAMILAVIGGIIGTALGIGVAALGTSVAGTPLALNMQSILLAVAFSAGVGLCFGFFPARKADVYKRQL